MPKDSDEHVEAQALTTAELEAFERDWADLEAHIAAIQSGAVEAPEVVEHLELLDAAPEATASDKRRAADAAHKTNMDEVESLCDAIESGTIEAPEIVEDFPDLDAAPEATASAAAPDDKSHEAVAKAESSVAATPAAAIDRALADQPEPVAPETKSDLEHLGELDASAEAAVECAIAKAEVYKDPLVEPTALSVEIRKYLAKLPKRGAARTAACEEFGVDPTDPMAVDKVKVAYKLKEFKATLTDLEAFWPGYWALPLETEGKDDKGEPFPSRALVLKKFEWRRYNEITSAKRKKLKESARLKKREAKIVAKGWPANFYDLSPADQKRERDRVWRQKKRTS